MILRNALKYKKHKHLEIGRDEPNFDIKFVCSASMKNVFLLFILPIMVKVSGKIAHLADSKK